MYESYYGLREKPFSLLPDPEFLFLGRRHGAALAMLEYGLMNRAGFTVITGEIGSGKTTLIRHLLDGVARDLSVGLITSVHRSFGEILQHILLAYGLEYRNKERVELYQAFVDFLISEYAAGRRAVLILDEAQNMDAEVLEELRMLSNINAEKDLVLQLVLAGQPELLDTLKLPALAQFAQRIAVDYHLDYLDPPETAEYIAHRITVAGGEETLFDAASCELVHAASRGVPRLVNVLCDTALVYGYAARAPRITAELMDEVVRDKSRSPLFQSALPAARESQTPGAEAGDVVPAARPRGRGRSGKKRHG